MKLVKISLVAAVAVASLSTASFADGMMSGVKITGKTDFRFKSVMTEDAMSSGFVRDRVDLNFVTKSSDGNGKIHFRTRYQSLGHKIINHDITATVASAGAVGVNKAYATYKMMGMTIGAGPKIGSPGKFSFSTNSGVTLTKKVGDITIKAGSFRNAKAGDKQIISTTGKMGPLTFALDYQMGHDKAVLQEIEDDEGKVIGKKDVSVRNYLATVAHMKIGPAKLGFGYAQAMGNGLDEKANKATMLGLSVGMSMAGIDIKGGWNTSGKGGGQIVEKKFGTGLPSELGDATNAQKADTTSFYGEVSKKVAGVKITGYYSSATQKDAKDSTNEIMLIAGKKLNAQSSIKVRYTNTATGDAKSSDVMVFFKSKI